MKLSAKCKHCGEGRMWEQLPDGSIVPTECDGPFGRQRYPYACAKRDGGPCEPIVLTSSERVTAELGKAIGKRIAFGGRKRR